MRPRVSTRALLHEAEMAQKPVVPCAVIDGYDDGLVASGERGQNGPACLSRARESVGYEAVDDGNGL